MPASTMSASTGSSRASTSACDSSRSAAKTGRGAWKMASVRSHHRFSGLAFGVEWALALTPGRLLAGEPVLSVRDTSESDPDTTGAGAAEPDGARRVQVLV